MDGIPAPPDCLYTSYEEAYNALKGHGMQNGYGFVLKESKPYHSDIKTRYYCRCDRFKELEIFGSQSAVRETRMPIYPLGIPMSAIANS
ncbi:hypothetical protein DL95DRAFT_465896 [Leptodontidium sp. 2 PMI_412]|nr:hypothetical protein DL95DRAFT_465896 [Leptodontidium sp. 2 PMI_412]